MNKFLKSLLIIIALISVQYNAIGQIDTDEDDYVYQISVAAPVSTSTERDTLRLQSGKPVLLFTYITERAIDIEDIENSHAFREWQELQSHYQDKIDFKYMNKYGVVEVNGKEKLSLDNPFKYYTGVFYWDGKASSPFKFFENFVCLTEEISAIRGEKLQSSYMKEYLEKKEWIESLMKLNNPADALKENIRYYDYYSGKEIKYFPFQFINIQGVKSVKIFEDNSPTDVIRFSINPQQCIDTITVFDSFGEIEKQQIYEFKDRLLVKKGSTLYAYNGDTIISYSSEYNNRASKAVVDVVMLTVRKGKYFIRQTDFYVNAEEKTITRKSIILDESGGGLLITGRGDKTLVSNTEWKLPYTKSGKYIEEKYYMNKIEKKLILDESNKYHNRESRISFHLDERGLIDKAEIYDSKNDVGFTLNYEYEFYK